MPELSNVNENEFPNSIARDADLDSHLSNLSNPHNVTAAQLGISSTTPDLDELSDVNITVVENGDILQWNAITSRWEISSSLTIHKDFYVYSSTIDTIPSPFFHINTDDQSIKMGSIVDGSYVEVESDGTLRFSGESSLWDDLRIVPGAFAFAGNADPTLVNWQPGGSGTTFKVYEFATNDEVYFSCQLPHGYKLGTNLHPHVHWTPGARGNEENGNTVNWALDYSISDIDGVFGAAQTINIPDTCQGTDHQHHMAFNGTIDGSNISGVSAMILCRLYRTTGDSWDSSSSGQLPLLLEFDFHYEIDTVGSRSEYLK